MGNCNSSKAATLPQKTEVIPKQQPSTITLLEDGGKKSRPADKMVVADEIVKSVEETVMPAAETDLPKTIAVDEAQVATKIQAAYRGKVARAEVAQARKAALEEREAAVTANSEMAMQDSHPQD